MILAVVDSGSIAAERRQTFEWIQVVVSQVGEGIEQSSTRMSSGTKAACLLVELID